MDEKSCREVSCLSLESGECRWSKRRRSSSSGDKLRHYKSYPLLPTELLIERGTMAPGTSSMLRARRRDVNVKPNRVLDRNSSRGMIYENEELRLRTININAEVERGQSDIKKLRRENDQLRREIWNLRDEYDRLETLLKAKGQHTAEDEEEGGSEDEEGGGEEEEEEEEEDEEEEEVEEEEKESDGDTDNDIDNSTIERDYNKQKHTVKQHMLSQQGDGLSVVEEEPEDIYDTTEGRPKVVSFRTEELLTQELEPVTADRTETQEFSTESPGLQEQLQAQTCKKMTIESPILTTGGSEVVTTAILQRRQSFAQSGNQTKDTITCTASTTTTLNGIYMQTQCEPYTGPGPQFLRLNSIQPYTIVFPVSSAQLNNLLVQEVIDSLSEQLPNKLMNSLKGVRLLGGNCFLSFSNQLDADCVLHLPLTLRGLPVLLEDASIGTTVLSLNGVPHNIDDNIIVGILSNFGNIVGGVERRLYKGVDTGERLVRLKARVPVPKTLWIGGCKAFLRVLNDTEIASLALTRRKSFRTHVSVQLQPLYFEHTENKHFPFKHNIVLKPAISTTQEITDVCMVSPDSSIKQEQRTLLQTKTETSTPFIFPTIPQYSSTPNLPTEGLKQTGINSIRVNSSQPGSPDISHTRSHSTPPCANNVSKTEISNSQPNTPVSPVISKRSSHHRVSKKVPKVNIEGKKLTGECSQSSSSGQDSPTKPERRRVSVYFKNKEKQGNSILSRTTSFEQGDRNTGDITTCSERERSNSDVSSRMSICKRKMSTTGRETGKVPWCGCWGNGCI